MRRPRLIIASIIPAPRAELLDRPILLSHNETAHPLRHAAIIDQDRARCTLVVRLAGSLVKC